MEYNDARLISLNTKDATKLNGSYNSNVVFNLRGVLKEEDDIVMTTIEVANYQIPISFYNINESNNILNYTLGGSKTITVSTGNYSATSLLSEITSKFLANGNTITISLNRINGVITINTASALTILNTSTLLTVLGFNTNTSYSSVANVLVALYPINLAGINRLSITSQNLATTSYSSNSISNILANASINKPPFSILTLDNSFRIVKILKSKIVDNIDFIIYDENGNLINFNGLDWTISLCLNIVRRKYLGNTLKFNDVVKTKYLEKAGNLRFPAPFPLEQDPPLEKDLQQPTDPELELLTS